MVIKIIYQNNIAIISLHKNTLFNLALYLLVSPADNFYKQFGPRSGTKDVLKKVEENISRHQNIMINLPRDKDLNEIVVMYTK